MNDAANGPTQSNMPLSNWARSNMLVRLGVGLAQGVILYGLSHAQDLTVWPATQPVLFAPLVLATLFAPFVILAGVGALKRINLIAWTVGATAFAAYLAFHGAWRGVGADGMPDA
ncbi:MAG: hypothetical protein PSX79_01625, partial [bacterium]|nr:hypothetical protein [bacterium]